jgi:hypothetical protein
MVGRGKRARQPHDPALGPAPWCHSNAAWAQHQQPRPTSFDSKLTLLCRRGKAADQSVAGGNLDPAALRVGLADGIEDALDRQTVLEARSAGNDRALGPQRFDDHSSQMVERA